MKNPRKSAKELLATLVLLAIALYMIYGFWQHSGKQSSVLPDVQVVKWVINSGLNGLPIPTHNPNTINK